ATTDADMKPPRLSGCHRVRRVRYAYLMSADLRRHYSFGIFDAMARLGVSATSDDVDVTGLLLAWRGGDGDALDRLMPLLYDELRRNAPRQLGHERGGHTLGTAGLVHEAYLKLVDQTRVQWVDRTHFFAVAARLMRRVLVSYARRLRAEKRGGAPERVSL